MSCRVLRISARRIPPGGLLFGGRVRLWRRSSALSGIFGGGFVVLGGCRLFWFWFAASGSRGGSGSMRAKSRATTAVISTNARKPQWENTFGHPAGHTGSCSSGFLQVTLWKRNQMDATANNAIARDARSIPGDHEVAQHDLLADREQRDDQTGETRVAGAGDGFLECREVPVDRQLAAEFAFFSAYVLDNPRERPFGRFEEIERQSGRIRGGNLVRGDDFDYRQCDGGGHSSLAIL
jgi:hypothetical protein